MGDYEGIVNFLKPPGMTSHDAVAFARQVFRQRRIGHAGTLDPAAAGVLPLCLGSATRIADFIQQQRKRYRAELFLGVATDSQDHLGQVVARAGDFSLPLSALETACRKLTGRYVQVPPMTSARRHQGRRLYEWAREGREIERPGREVTVYRIDVVPGVRDPSKPLTPGSRVLLDVECSKGTYVRTLCHDIGRRLGTWAHMSFLVRLAVGPFRIEDSVTCEQLQAFRPGSDEDTIILPLERGLEHLPALTVTVNAARRFSHGQAVFYDGPLPEGVDHVAAERDGLPDLTEEQPVVRVHDDNGTLCGLARFERMREGSLLRPFRVFRSPVDSAGAGRGQSGAGKA